MFRPDPFCFFFFLVLFVSRGRGHGHAIPDSMIAHEIGAIHPRFRIDFASYSAGATTLREFGWKVIDLQLRDDSSFIDALLAYNCLINERKPDVVIAHEEFSAVVAARLCKAPCIFISTWIPPSGTMAAEAIIKADSVIVIENPGIFPVPVGMQTRPQYVGPILRRLEFTAKDRQEVRQSLGIDPKAVVILAVTRGWASEKRSPIADVVLAAFAAIANPNKRLIWIASADFEATKNRLREVDGVQVFGFYKPIERLIAAANLVITKGTRGITLDAAVAGVPTISLSHGLNPVDDILVPRIPSNIALNANAVDADVLLHYINYVLSLGSNPASIVDPPGADIAAQTVVSEIERVLKSNSGPPATAKNFHIGHHVADAVV